MQRSINLFCHLCMKQLLLTIALASCLFGYAQKTQKLQLNLQLQPEITFNQNNVSDRWAPKYTNMGLSLGAAASLQYHVTKRFFVEAGLGFISRRIYTVAFINQSKLPPPYADSHLVLFKTK